MQNSVLRFKMCYKTNKFNLIKKFFMKIRLFSDADDKNKICIQHASQFTQIKPNIN